MDSDALNDDESPEVLAGRVLAGDRDAVGRWYRREYREVVRLCLGLLADPGAAEELAQDAMTHLLDRLSRWPTKVPYAVWRTTVVTNLCRDAWRRRETRRRREDEAARHAIAATTLPDPADAAHAAEVREILVEALAAVPPREREAFVLRDLEGHAFPTIATMLEVTESTVRSLVTLARRRLRGLLGARLAADSDGGHHRA